jgi:hypothetical protein
MFAWCCLSFRIYTLRLLPMPLVYPGVYLSVLLYYVRLVLFCLFGEMWLWFHASAVLFYVSNCDVYCSPDVVKSLRIVMLCSTCASLVFRDYVGYTFTLYVECFNIIWNIDVFLVLTNMLHWKFGLFKYILILNFLVWKIFIPEKT